MHFVQGPQCALIALLILIGVSIFIQLELNLYICSRQFICQLTERFGIQNLRIKYYVYIIQIYNIYQVVGRMVHYLLGFFQRFLLVPPSST